MNINRSFCQSISIINDVITIDGVVVKTGNKKVINITIGGNCEEVIIDNCLTVTVQGVTGSVKTVSGDVKCDDIGGNVSTISGDVRATKIAGSVSTVSGDINY